MRSSRPDSISLDNNVDGVVKPVTQSQLGLGCVTLGNNGRAGARLVHHALDLGVRFFDTADSYGSGQSERVLGRALGHRRDEAFIATKAGYMFTDGSAVARAARNAARSGLQVARRLRRPAQGRSDGRGTNYRHQDFSPPYLRRALEASLRRLATDYVDLFQLHGPDAFHDDVCALMLDLRSEGKIRGSGIGLETLDFARAWLTSGALSSIQVPFGVLDPEAGIEVIPHAAQAGVSVIVRAVFAAGFVARPGAGDMARLRPGQPEVLRRLSALAGETGVDTRQLATWFVTAKPGVTTVLIGTSSAPHLSDAVRYLRTPAPEPVLRALEAVAGNSPMGEPGAPAIGGRDSR